MSPENSKSWPSYEEAFVALRDGDGAGVKIAVIDSGIEVSHPALAGRTLLDDVAISCDGVHLRIEEGGGRDVYGHGTAIASLIWQMAPGAQIGSFRALDSSNLSRSFVIAECVNQAIARGYQVINCSFGCRGLPRYVMDYKEWVDQAYLAGAQIVAACSNIDASIREWPAYFPSVVSVRGIDCPTDVYHFRPEQMVSFLAQGERVEVPWLNGTSKIETGSSYAAPLMAGRIARVRGALPDLPSSAIKPLLAVLATKED